MSSLLSQPQAGASIVGTLSSTLGAAANSSNVNHTVGTQKTPYTVGSSAAQVQFIFTNTYAVTSGTPQVLDLTTLTDALGNSITFNAWTNIIVENLSTTTGQDFSIGAGTNPIFTAEGEPIFANGGWFATGNPQGQTVDSTHKTLQLTVAAGTSVQVKVTIMGR